MLSRYYPVPKPVETPEPILLASLVVAPVTWDINSEIARGMRTNTTPQGCPLDRTYVPDSMHQQVVEEAHTNVTSGHPGVTRTATILRCKYWWPNMQCLVNTVVQSCLVCATTKSPHSHYVNKLLPLPIPDRLWTQVAVDFVTDLPESKGYTVILVMVDRFSKGCKFIPFCCLPSARQVAEVLFQHVFRCYGLPEDILSDRGPQFVSRV